MNREPKRLRDRRYYLAHRDKWKERWRQNREQINRDAARRRALNPEKNRRQCREDYRRHRTARIKKATEWIERNRELALGYNRKTFRRYVSELHPIYVGQKLKWNNKPPTRKNLSVKKTNIQLCRTKRLFATLAVAGVLKSTSTP